MGIDHQINKKRQIAEIAASRHGSPGTPKALKSIGKGKPGLQIGARARKKQKKELKNAAPPPGGAETKAKDRNDGTSSEKVVKKKMKEKKAEAAEDNVPEDASRRAVGAATGCAFPELPLEKPLHAELLAGVTALKFTHTTPVQQVTIPLLLSNKDVAVQACTGSGKTAAFLIPVFELLLRCDEPWRPRDVGAIIIAPTRELAMQIMSVARVMAQHVDKLSLLELTGGSDAVDTRELLEAGANIIVGTPGRLEHTLQSVGELVVKKLEVLILDEADRLLDMGFQASLNAILARLPKQRRTGLFSATMGAEVEALARAGLRNPRQVKVSVQGRAAAQSTPLQLENEYIIGPETQKLCELVRFLRLHPDKKVMVYVLTCAQVDYLAKLLPLLPSLAGLRFDSLHGKMVQKRRSKTYATFTAGHAGVLLCTDVAARGLDIPDVDWIVQLDAPQDPTFFIHRVGRTARFGREGRSLVLLAPHEDAYVAFLKLRKVPLKEVAGRADEAGARALQAEARAVIAQDLELHQQGTRAFVSLVRAYREHQCNYIFQLDKLNLGGVAFYMGLLRLPKMPELNGLKVSHFSADASVDVYALEYKDKAREKARRLREEKRAAEEAAKVGERGDQRVQRMKNLPWSQSNKRLAKEVKKEEKIVAKGKKKREEEEGEEGGGASSGESEEDFAKEARLLKKLKTGKLSQAEFDRQMGLDDLDSD